jgi:Tol biopolymer transport system component
VAALCLVVALTILYFRRMPAELPAFRLSILPPGKIAADTLALSPNGRRLAFAARDASGKVILWVRPLDAVEAQPLPGTEQASISSAPVWSPDGRSLAFFAGGKLKKIELDGGTRQTICTGVNGRGGTWNRDGVILFQPALDDTLHRVTAAGGASTPLVLVNSLDQISTYRWPQFLPDGRRFLCYHPGGQASGIYAGALDSRELKLVLKTHSNAIYVPTGHLFFWREGALLAQPFDADKLQLTGEPVQIAEQVSYSSGIFHAAFSISDNGVLAYLSGSFHNTQLVWFDRSGKQLGVAAPPGEYLRMALARDEQRVAFERNDSLTGTSDIWLVQLAQGVTSRLTFDRANEELPVWSPDGNHIAFTSDREGHYNIYQKLASGAGEDELLLKSSSKKLTTNWSRDGRFILYTEEDDPETKADLWVLPLHGERKPDPYLRLPSNEYEGAFSPNGRWVAYMSDETGVLRIHVQSFPPSGGKWQISPGVGRYAQWRPDGKELYYLSGDGKLMAVEVKTDATFEVSVSRTLFDLRTDAGVGSRRPYAVASDGQRFLVNVPVEEANTTLITVLLNWAAEAKK